MESIPGIYTGAEDPNKVWGAPYKKKVPVQAQSTKRPPEMDVVPAGVKLTIGSKPDVMHMADHDHGVAWPPVRPGDVSSIPFMAMVKEKPNFHHEVNGIMIGYQGHVPRARDKVGACPLGGVPGRPGAPSKSPLDPRGLVQSSNNTVGMDEPPLYISEAHDPQGRKTFKKPQNPVGGRGVMPGYAGHVHRARYTVGLSPFETEDTKMKEYEKMDWESDEWGDGDLSDMDIKLMKMGYSAPGGDNYDAAKGYWERQGQGGYQGDGAGDSPDYDEEEWRKKRLGL